MMTVVPQKFYSIMLLILHLIKALPGVRKLIRLIANVVSVTRWYPCICTPYLSTTGILKIVSDFPNEFLISHCKTAPLLHSWPTNLNE
mgnify:CR=1 FL=1